MLNRVSGRCIAHTVAMALVCIVILSDQCARGDRTWDAGGDGVYWDHNCNWSGPEDQGVCFGFQPFDGDNVSIPFGNPVVRFIEGINTLDVAPGVTITNNSVLGVHNGVENDGLITLGTDAQLGIDVGVLNGAGEVVLGDSTGTYAAISGAPFGFTPVPITHAATHTIRGEGTVQGKWINNGLIRAEETSGDSTAELAISGTMTNNGVIRSSATGSVYLVSLSLTMGPTGQFIADGTPIQLGVTTITGGSINAINGAKFVRRPDSGGFTTFSGVTINGDFDVLVTNAGVYGAGTGITNNGTITLDNLGVNVEFSMAAGSTLDGTGQLVLNRQTDSVHVYGSFTHGASHTIRGAGRIHNANIVNNGTILAEPKTGGGLLRLAGNTITGNNLMQANNGATMRLEGGVVTQLASGRIRAADGGRVELRDHATINGGKLQTAGTGLIVTTTASILNSVTNEGEFQGLTGTTTRVNTTLINNGTITVNPSGTPGATGIEFVTDTVLSGTGTIVLNQTGNNAFISSAQSNQDITQAAGHTIRGGGRISSGYFGDGKFINNGRMEGNSAAQPLVIQAKLSGTGTFKDVQIGGDGFAIYHAMGEVGTTAVVAVEGSYNFISFNSMLFDLAGTTPGTGYDQLNSTGAITISPTGTRLEVSRIAGFFPTPGQSFTLLTTTGSLTGNFGAVALPTLPFGLSWTQSQTSTSFTIGVTGSIAADFDSDGDVDNDDLIIWQGGYGSGTLKSQGNADGDGDVDGRDFMIWQRSFGWGVAPLLAATAVPEPSALFLGTFLFTTTLVGRKCQIPLL